jgi:riboflavin kinase / FMN adenylyltransferase
MEIHEGYDDLDLVKPVVTLGIFDGVHRGHRILLDTLVKRARDTGGDSVVITFDPHPRLVLEKNDLNLVFLSSMEEKKELLEKAHVSHLIIIRFTMEFSRMKACDFVREILSGKVKTSHLIMGHDHHFGYRGEGNFETVNECAASMGFEVEQVAGLKSKEGAISSSLVREALMKADLNNANKWLGYCYSLRGKVIPGKKVGRKLGFPTANIEPDYRHKLIPANGVYAVDVFTGGVKKAGMLSIGTNPTINPGSVNRSIEVNIFDFEEDIYGSDIEVAFRYRLRDEKKFDSPQQLALQMESDREIALKLLA